MAHYRMTLPFTSSLNTPTIKEGRSTHETIIIFRKASAAK
jgi:hypothetical protein